MDKEKIEELRNRLYELQNKEIKDYTQDDNVFFYACYHGKERSISELAQNTVIISMTQYIQNKAKDLVMSRKSIKHLNEETIMEVFSAGLESAAKKLKDYDPSRKTQIHTYLTPWMDAMMNKELDYEIKGYELEEHELRRLSWIRTVEPFLKEQGIKEPTAQDYVNRALEEGKDPEKYNITIISRVLNYKNLNEFGVTSLEQEESGVTDATQEDPASTAVGNIMIENDYQIIQKLGYFDRVAILCKIESEDYSPEEFEENQKKKISENKNKKNKRKKEYTYNKFLKETGISNKELSPKDFERLLSDAINEFRKRKYEKMQRPKKKNKQDNSLQLDNSYDVFFEMDNELNNEMGMTIDPAKVENIIRSEFESAYPQNGIVIVQKMPKATDSTTVIDMSNM